MKIKKIISAAFAAVLLLLCCACGKEEEPAVKTSADMLSIVDTESTYLGCVSRFRAVTEPLCAVVNILETQNNDIIKQQNEKDYFLNEKYISAVFEPFEFSHIALTELFDETMNSARAKEEYKIESEGADILFDGRDECYTLKFVSEAETKKITAEYDEKNDSFRYMYSVETDGGEQVEEFLEFAKTADGGYLVQTQRARAYISFDEQNKAKEFFCSELKSGDYSDASGIYPSNDITAESAEGWVFSLASDCYVSIHTYKENILTHEDCSGGVWKKVEINALGYASAFYI